VVTGFVNKSKVSFTGSQTTVQKDQLLSMGTKNVLESLQSFVPGLVIAENNLAGSNPNSRPELSIRGRATFDGSANMPLFVVDGTEVSADYVYDMDMNDIESVTVLKDASASALYGSKASNGVILVTTKRGKTGKPVVSYNGNVGFLNATRLVERLSSYEYAKMYNDALAANGKKVRWSDEDLKKFADGSDPDGHPNTDWYGLAYKTGVQHSHNVNVSGGTDLVKYMASAGYMNQEGILQSSNRERFTMRTNLDFNFSPKLTGHVGLNFIQDNHNDPHNNYVGGGS